jgi:hypothetical protein
MRTLALLLGILNIGAMFLTLALPEMHRALWAPAFFGLVGVGLTVMALKASRQPRGRSDFDINLSRVHCPKCGELMPRVRLPHSLRETLWGGHTCPKCGCEMDRWGKEVES